MRICIYGSANEEIPEEFKKMGFELGEKIAKNNHKLIFGGGDYGMMGAVSKGAFYNNGEVLGITPHYLSNECTYGDNLIKTLTLSERKQKFLKEADIFIILPGGLGTLDEFFELIDLKKLKRHNKEIILFNMNNFYDKLIDLIDYLYNKGFISEKPENIFKISESVTQTMNIINKV